jgi:transposase
MARPRQPLDTHGQADEVLLLLKKTKPGWQRDRLLVIKLGLENELSIYQIAHQLGHSHTSVQAWFNAFREGGLEQLLCKKPSGNGFAAALDAEQMEMFRVELTKGKWRTGGQAYAWLKEKFGITFHPNGIYRYLKKLDGRLKSPRPSHQKKDLHKLAKFQEELTQKLIDLDLDPKRPVRLWIYDEMRYGLAPVTRKMWTTKGTEIIAPVHHRYEWGYLYGALQVGGGGCEFLFSPQVNKSVDAIFLEQISKRDPYAMHVVIGDGAGFHHKEGQDHEGKIPENIRILTLPPYSPELNPVERLWDVIKDGICTTAYQSLENLEKAITRELREFWEDQKRVFSLVGDGYLLSKLNAI